MVILGVKEKREEGTFEVTGVDIDKVIDGKIVEHGGAANTFEAFWAMSLIMPGSNHLSGRVDMMNPRHIMTGNGLCSIQVMSPCFLIS